MQLGKVLAAADQLHDQDVPVGIVGAEARHQRVDLGERRIALHHHVAGGFLLQRLRGHGLIGLHLLDEKPRALAADDGVVVMPPRALHDHHVAVDDGAAVEEASLEEVVDKIVFVHCEERRPGVRAGPPRVKISELASAASAKTRRAGVDGRGAAATLERL